MVDIYGYGEDSLTLWALNERLPEILKKLEDKNDPSDCLVFYRPSFGRHRQASGASFGEFDAIIVTRERVYLVESKWDNLRKVKSEEIALDHEQILRHRIFTWYLMHWNEEYSGDWQRFQKKWRCDFKFEGKTIPKKGSLLAANLELILTKTFERCEKISVDKVKNVLLFFFDGEEPEPKIRTNSGFVPVLIGYSKETTCNFVTLVGETNNREQP